MALPQGIETERLALRRHVKADAPAVARLLDDWDVVKWLAQVPFPYTEKDALDWIVQTARNWAEGREYQLGIALRSTGELVGHIGLRMDPDSDSAELGYWLGKPHWGRGYGTEAARSMVRFGFVQLRLDRIWATCLPDNQRSLKVLGKAGLAVEGKRMQEFATRGVTVEVPVLGLARTDWQRVRSDALSGG